MIKHLVKIIWNQRRRNGGLPRDPAGIRGSVVHNRFANGGWEVFFARWMGYRPCLLDLDGCGRGRPERDGFYLSIHHFRTQHADGDRPYQDLPGCGGGGCGADVHAAYGREPVHACCRERFDKCRVREATGSDTRFSGGVNFRPMEGEKKDWEEMLNGRQVVLSAGLFREFQEKGGKRDEGISFWGDRRSIGGVTADFRADRFTKSCSWLFMPLTDEEIAEDDTDFHVKIAIRVNPSADHDFPEFFVKQMEKQLSIDRLYLLDVIPYSDLRYSMELRNGVKSELQNQIAVMGFLLFNIFLGIIGTFWFRTEQRKGEMGLRIALGSTRFSLKGIMIAEGVLLLTLIAIPALLICFNLHVSELTKGFYMDYTIARFVEGFFITYLVMAVMIILGICIRLTKWSGWSLRMPYGMNDFFV